MANRKTLEIIMLVFAIAVMVGIYFLEESGSFRFENIKRLGYLGVFLIMLISSATILVPIPGLVAAFFAGAMLNPFLVGIFGGIGSAIGELTGYSAGYGSRIIIEDRKLKNYEKVKKWMGKNGFLTILILAFLPNPFFDIAGIAAGALEYPAWKFLFACSIGKSIRFMLLALIGASLL